MIDCEVVYCSWLFVRSKLCLPFQRKTRPLCHCFVISGFLARPILHISRSCFMDKKGRQIFSKIILASKLMRYKRTLQINNAHLNRSRCWQHWKNWSGKKTFSFTVSLTETNKAPLFFSELGSNLIFRRFLSNRWCWSLQKSIQKD